MKTEYTTFSEAGRRRANQDVFCVVEIPEQECTLFVVCDGMGGHAMGDVAAETVCNTICRFWQENPQYKDSVQKTKDACSQAAEALYRRSRVVRPIEMGTTLAMASIEGEHCNHCTLWRQPLLSVAQRRSRVPDKRPRRHGHGVRNCLEMLFLNGAGNSSSRY